MSEYPHLPLFCDVWVAKTAHLTRAERGLYHDLLVLMWTTPECRVPSDIAWIARKLRCDADEVSMLSSIMKEFCEDDGNWITQKRLRKERQFVIASRKKQSARAKSRWNKEKKSCHGNAMPHVSGNAPTPTPKPISSGVSNDTPLEAALREAAGWQNHPAPNLFVTGPIEAVIKAGADLHADVLPVIRAHAPRCRSPNWKFFISAIQQATADRRAAGVIPEGGNTNDRSRPGSISDAFAKFDAAFDQRLAEIDAGTGEGNSPADIIPLPRLREGNA